jgi:hypothetical protein
MDMSPTLEGTLLYLVHESMWVMELGDLRCHPHRQTESSRLPRDEIVKSHAPRPDTANDPLTATWVLQVRIDGERQIDATSGRSGDGRLELEVRHLSAS